MAVVENVIIDFSVDYSELDGAIAELEKTGKLDASIGKAFSRTSQGITSAAKDTKSLIAEFKSVATTATKMGKSVEAAFGAGIQDALDEAGVSAEEFAEALKKANAPAKTLKAELRELKEALAQAKVNGKDAGAEFENMRDRAGALADAIDDANSEIKNMASDTRGIDNIVGSITALAGGFSAVQGAAALFGNENEDLQKALLKVNGAMALATGLQQIQIAVQKEGALTKLADSVATGAQTAATTLYTFVTNGATIATKALRAAIISTGIGAVVVLVIALVQAMSNFKDETESAADAQQRLAEATERMNKASEEQIEFLNTDARLRKLRAQIAGASELELTNIEISEIKKRISFREKEISAAIKNGLSISELAKANNDDIQALNEAELNAIIVRNKANEDAAKKADQLRKEDAQKTRDKITKELQDAIYVIERKLLSTEKESKAELDLKQALVLAKSKLELNADKVTVEQAKLIRRRANKEQENLEDEFNKRISEKQLQSQIDTNNALLAGINVTNEQRLQLQISNISATSQLEINAAEGNAEKIILIEEKKAEAIRNIRNQIIKDELQAQQEASAKTNDIVRNALNKLVSDTKQSVDARKAASKGLQDQELSSISLQIEANNKLQQSNEDFYKKNQDLLEQKAQAMQANSDRIIEIDNDEKKRLKGNAIVYAQLTIDILGQAAEFAAQLGQLQSDREQQRIEAKKKELQDLVEAGAITQKQAEIRAKQIEILERQQKQKQAAREKQAAVFNAILAIPQAALKGLVDGGPILAAIYSAIAAAQAALVIARPVPKFFRGKKDSYQGPGVVGDMGAELVERDGRMFLYTKPTQTYLNANDKVYTAAETRAMMHNSSIRPTIANASGSSPFDYDKFAKAIPKSSFSVNIDKDFIEESVAKGLTRHFNNRYKFN